ncbi:MULTISPECIES: hypothetical protein [Bacillus]|uniref:Uncharacterized protein n=1 Tax=Bacillus glycinifermentans TaxID=1664069 RepID=A0A0T6BI92_9BACI|nr:MULTISPECIES: hypothetical protein [Bacillus]KRT87147.1 hypothetical protein AB447_209285 [Bacillus glycinifermentans]MEC0341960.1 hypothetical protein [Bacillus sonorensis]MEC0457526.1 hypothetical protein [Bacillus sonorensis]MEC0487202.1 hypothetical protein [Bacillus glycinifermentans]MEC0530679.1 hypothetical protein [Bacillus sonorensis]
MKEQTFLDFGKRSLTKEDEQRLKSELNDYFKKRKERIYASKRKKLLNTASKINFVPGHAPDFDKMSNERIKSLIKIAEIDK